MAVFTYDVRSIRAAACGFNEYVCLNKQQRALSFCSPSDCCSSVAPSHQRWPGSKSSSIAPTGRPGRLLASSPSSPSSPSLLRLPNANFTAERRHDDHPNQTVRRIAHQRLRLRMRMAMQMAMGATFSQQPGVICRRKKNAREAIPSPCWSSQKECGSHWRKKIQARASSEARIPSAPSAELDLELPPIDNDIRDVQTRFGAVFNEGCGGNVAVTFGNDVEAIEAAKTHAVVIDQTHYGRIRVSDEDRIRFLHNQSTADFQMLKPGQGCDTVFVTSTARTIDLATAYIMNSSALVVASPSVRHELVTTLDKYIFFADKVKVEDITDRTAMLSIIGPKSGEILEDMKAGAVVGTPYGTNMHFELFGEPVTIASGAGLASEGYTLITTPDSAGLVWEKFVGKGAVPMGEAAWEKLRILEGRPSPGKELTRDYNPLEAGLWKTISLNKGCYIGQETIARVITYDALKQQLWGLELEGPAEPGTMITTANSGEKVGKLTSLTEVNGKFFGLGYIKRTAGGEGTQVSVGGTKGLVVEVPYLTRSLTQ